MLAEVQLLLLLLLLLLPATPPIVLQLLVRSFCSLSRLCASSVVRNIVGSGWLRMDLGMPGAEPYHELRTQFATPGPERKSE